MKIEIFDMVTNISATELETIIEVLEYIVTEKAEAKLKYLNDQHTLAPVEKIVNGLKDFKKLASVVPTSTYSLRAQRK